MIDDVIVEVKDLRKHFPQTQGILFKRKTGNVLAVDGVSFAIHQGETLGLVGESGCGKSTIGKTILQLHEPTSGEVYFRGKNIVGLPERELSRYRQKLQVIFQDPYASLNPRMTIGASVGEGIAYHRLLPPDRRNDRVKELLERVGLSAEFVQRYPHELSGGQRQRVGIARALALNPDFIICDEPISALDVSIQAQVVNLLKDLQRELGLTYLFISHDLSMVRHLSHRIAVMYLGKIVELTDKSTLYSNPLHPYTEALLSAVPIPDPVVEAKRRRVLLSGDVPNPAKPPTGCRFHTRCPLAEKICREKEPPLVELHPNHHVACHVAVRRERSKP